MYHFLVNFMDHNSKMIEKSVFRKSLNPKLRPQSFPDPVLGLAVFFSKPEVKFNGFGTSKHGEERLSSSIFSLILISTLWRCYRANKKDMSHIQLKRKQAFILMRSSRCRKYL